MGKQRKQWQTIFLGSKITADGDCSHEIKRHLLLERKAMTNLDSNIKKQRHYFADKGLIVKAIVFSLVIYGWIWELDHKEDWAPKNWCFTIVVLKKALKSPLDCKKIKPVNPEENQPWIFIERTDPKAPILWPPDAKSWLIGKDLDAVKNWRHE